MYFDVLNLGITVKEATYFCRVMIESVVWASNSQIAANKIATPSCIGNFANLIIPAHSNELSGCGTRSTACESRECQLLSIYTFNIRLFTFKLLVIANSLISC